MNEAKRIRRGSGWRLALLVLLCCALVGASGCAPGRTGCATALSSDAGVWFQFCSCPGGAAQARELAAALVEKLPGLEARVESAWVAGPDGKREVGEVFLRHPSLSPAQVCARLREAGCPLGGGASGQ